MAAPKLSSFKCPTCSAPMQVRPDVSDLTCNYCGNSVHVERDKAAFTRMGASRGNTVYVNPNAGKQLVWIIVLTTVLPILIPIGIGVAALGKSLVGSRVMSLPATCDANEEMTISGKTFDGKGPVIIAGINCKITIKDSHLKSDIVVKGGQNLELKIINSTLEGSDAAIDLEEVNTKIDISEKSEIKGKDAIRATNHNLEMTVKDSKIVGVDNGIIAKQGFKMKATNVEISGKVTAVDSGDNPELELHQVKITSAGTAVTANNNLKIEADGSSIDGGEVAVHAKYNFKGNLKKKSSIVSKKGIAVEADSNVEITLDDSTLDGGEVALRGPSNLHLKVAKKSRVHATGTAVEGDSNPEVTVDDGIIEGGDVAVTSKVNGKIKVVKGGRITAAKIAIDGKQNLEIDVQGGTIDSPGVAIAGTFNTQVRLKKGTVTGGTAAFAFDRKPNVLDVSPDSVVTGAQKIGK
ncbi:MAG: hypothetical protein JWM74_5501 [Myxococcaceae bacterium]|nr:hypothetical protein [Myxococcaceae bacterium]